MASSQVDAAKAAEDAQRKAAEEAAAAGTATEQVSAEERAEQRQAARAADTLSPQEKAKALADADVRRKIDRGELSDVVESDGVGDDKPWVSTKGAKKMDFLVKCKIRGTVQGRKLIIGTVAELECTADIAHLIRPGVLEAVSNTGRS